jgi:hypothetical protein
MASHKMTDENSWRKAFEADPELGACIRKVSSVVLEEVTGERLRRAKAISDQVVLYFQDRKERLEEVVHELGCLEEVLRRIATFSGEGQLLKENLESRRNALLEERMEIEIRLRPEDLPARAEGCIKTYEEMKIQRENAEFFLFLLDGGTDASAGGVPGVADEPRSGGDNGATPDPLCDL